MRRNEIFQAAVTALLGMSAAGCDLSCGVDPGEAPVADQDGDLVEPRPSEGGCGGEGGCAAPTPDEDPVDPVASCGADPLPDYVPIHDANPAIRARSCDELPEADFASACPSSRTLYVVPGATGTTGSAEDPLGSLDEAIALCATEGCDLRVGEGSFEVAATELPSCFRMLGGLAHEGATFTRGATRTQITLVAESLLAGANFWLEGVDATGSFEVVSFGTNTQLAAVVDSRLHGDYGALRFEESAGEAMVCGSDLDGGYHGVTATWGSSGILIEDSALSGGHVALEASWSASHILVRHSELSAEDAADITSASHDIDFVDTKLEGLVSLMDDTSNVLFEGVTSDALPAADEARGIAIQ